MTTHFRFHIQPSVDRDAFTDLWQFLRDRLSQNSVQEKLTAAWVDRCLRRLNLRAAAAE